jgi:hypothetical protein
LALTSATPSSNLSEPTDREIPYTSELTGLFTIAELQTKYSGIVPFALRHQFELSPFDIFTLVDIIFWQFTKNKPVRQIVIGG